LSGQTPARSTCPQCGFIPPSNDALPPNAFYRPWHLRGKNAVKTYVESLGLEAREWLLALYVDQSLELLAVDTIARGDVGSCRVPFGRILCRGYRLGADAFILVHNHPSGDPTPSPADIRMTVRLAGMASELDMPLLNHLIIAGGEIKSCGHF